METIQLYVKNLLYMETIHYVTNKQESCTTMITEEVTTVIMEACLFIPPQAQGGIGPTQSLLRLGVNFEEHKFSVKISATWLVLGI